MSRPRTDGPAAWTLSAFMVGSGVMQFAASGYFRDLVPSWLPARAAVVAVSGVADIAVGVLVAVPATRRARAWATGALITAYLPAHLEPLRRGDLEQGHRTGRSGSRRAWS